jgi:hypothetical protein
MNNQQIKPKLKITIMKKIEKKITLFLSVIILLAMYGCGTSSPCTRCILANTIMGSVLEDTTKNQDATRPNNDTTAPKSNGRADTPKSTYNAQKQRRGPMGCSGAGICEPNVAPGNPEGILVQYCYSDADPNHIAISFKLSDLASRQPGRIPNAPPVIPPFFFPAGYAYNDPVFGPLMLPTNKTVLAGIPVTYNYNPNNDIATLLVQLTP